ncbi:MAG: hypothetical protein ACR2KE_10515 [Candidatus Nanopelagicales bacterium]
MYTRPSKALVVLAGAMLLSACGGTAATVNDPTASPASTAATAEDSAATSQTPSASVESPAASEVTDAFANPEETLADPDASAEDLVDAWFGLLALAAPGGGKVATSSEEVEASMKVMRTYLDPAFTLVRATGQRYTAGNYVPVSIRAYELSDFVVTEPREDIRVIRFFVSQTGATSPDAGVVLSEEKAPRIVVLRWDARLGHWVMVSYANFNKAIAAICERDPIVVRGETLNTSKEDLALGMSLVKWEAANAMGKPTDEVEVSPAFQVQFADGEGWPTTGEAMIDDWTPATSYDYDNVGVARNGDLIVVSYDAVVDGIVIEGEDYRDTATPRLATYLRNSDGKWQRISMGSFNVPEDIPADVECVSLAP